jgi:hypothetical protein
MMMGMKGKEGGRGGVVWVGGGGYRRREGWRERIREVSFSPTFALLCFALLSLMNHSIKQ